MAAGIMSESTEMAVRYHTRVNVIKVTASNPESKMSGNRLSKRQLQVEPTYAADHTLDHVYPHHLMHCRIHLSLSPCR